MSSRRNRPRKRTARRSAPKTTRDLPLAGITVVDLGQIYQGPYATLLMAKAGADVVKVEPPNGEPARRRAGAGATFPFAMLNSNKRSVTLNLKAARGRELLLKMVKRADVLLENFAPGVMDKLGVGFKVLHKINPRLVYASGSGFGLSGPDRDLLAMDLTVQAYAGVMSVNGFPDAPPVRAGVPFTDFLGGAHLYAAVVTALYERSRTRRGRLVEVALQDATYPTLASNLGFLYASRGGMPPRVGSRHGGLAIAPYNVYRTKDGHVALLCMTESHWTNLLEAMKRADLRDDARFATNAARAANMDATDAVVQAWIETLTSAEAFALTRRWRIPAAPVRELSEVMHDPHLHARGMLEWIDHPDLGRVVLPTSPLRLHGAKRVPTTPSPRLGAHNREIYGGWLGLDDGEIERLHEAGVI